MTQNQSIVWDASKLSKGGSVEMLPFELATDLCRVIVTFRTYIRTYISYNIV